jgi:lysozyme
MNISGLAMALDIAFDAQPDGLDYLEAYQDPIGIWTIGRGITRMPNGQPVKKGDKLTAHQAAMLNDTTTTTIEQDVLDLISVPINQNQFDALFLLVKNIGIGAFRTSSVLEHLNAGRYADAAYHFGDWVYAAKQTRKLEDGTIVYASDPNGDPLPLGRKWYVAYRGLYRRHISEALLFLGLNWTKAAHEDRIELRATPIWEPTKNRWKDRVDYKTEWEDILREARKHPLPVMLPDKPRTVAAENAETVDLNNAQLIKLGGTPGQPIKPAPLPVAARLKVSTPKAKQVVVLNPAIPPKPIEKSQTVQKHVKAQTGKKSTVIGTIGGIGTGGAALAAQNFKTINDSLSSIPPVYVLTGLAIGATGLVVWGVWDWMSGEAEKWDVREQDQGAKV